MWMENIVCLPMKLITESIWRSRNMSGMNVDELGRMRGAERRKVMRAAGLNPDEYDF